MITSARAAGGSARTVRRSNTTQSNSPGLPSGVPELLRDGQAAHGAAVVVRALPRRGDEPRRAVVASRKVGGAVARNRAKRRLREAMRAAGISPDVDVVVIARGAALSVPMPQLTAELRALAGRLEEKLAVAAKGAQ
ncbi:MAG TPA: ribonuclease P protein component [Egibacteraceae bacterium]|nr:ribonuclease P protein component [Egibacteraceae bacterium]